MAKQKMQRLAVGQFREPTQKAMRETFTRMREHIQELNGSYVQDKEQIQELNREQLINSGVLQLMTDGHITHVCWDNCFSSPTVLDLEDGNTVLVIPPHTSYRAFKETFDQFYQ